MGVAAAGRELNVGGERNVAFHLIVNEMKIIFGKPHVLAATADTISFGVSIKFCAALFGNLTNILMIGKYSDLLSEAVEGEAYQKQIEVIHAEN